MKLNKKAARSLFKHRADFWKKLYTDDPVLRSVYVWGHPSKTIRIVPEKMMSMSRDLPEWVRGPIDKDDGGDLFDQLRLDGIEIFLFSEIKRDGVKVLELGWRYLTAEERILENLENDKRGNSHGPVTARSKKRV